MIFRVSTLWGVYGQQLNNSNNSILVWQLYLAACECLSGALIKFSLMVFFLDIGFSQRRTSNIEYSDTVLMDMLCELIRPKIVILSRDIFVFWCISYSLIFLFFIIVSFLFCIPTSLSPPSSHPSPSLCATVF